MYENNTRLSMLSSSTEARLRAAAKTVGIWRLSVEGSKRRSATSRHPLLRLITCSLSSAQANPRPRQKTMSSAALRRKSGGSRGSQTRVPPCMPRRGSHRCPRSWACACSMPCDIRIGSHASRFRGVPSSHSGRPMRRRRSLKRASDLRGSKAGRSRMDGLNCVS